MWFKQDLNRVLEVLVWTEQLFSPVLVFKFLNWTQSEPKNPSTRKGQTSLRTGTQSPVLLWSGAPGRHGDGGSTLTVLFVLFNGLQSFPGCPVSTELRPGSVGTICWWVGPLGSVYLLKPSKEPDKFRVFGWDRLFAQQTLLLQTEPGRLEQLQFLKQASLKKFQIKMKLRFLIFYYSEFNSCLTRNVKILTKKRFFCDPFTFLSSSSM